MKCGNCPLALPCMQGVWFDNHHAFAVIINLCQVCGLFEVLPVKTRGALNGPVYRVKRALYFRCEKRNLLTLQQAIIDAPKDGRGIQVVDPVSGGFLPVSACIRCDGPRHNLYVVEMYEDLDMQRITFSAKDPDAEMAKKRSVLLKTLRQVRKTNTMRERYDATLNLMIRGTGVPPEYILGDKEKKS